MEGQAKNEAFFQFTEFDERKLNSKRVYSNVSPFKVESGLIYCSLWRYARLTQSHSASIFARKPATLEDFHGKLDDQSSYLHGHLLIFAFYVMLVFSLHTPILFLIGLLFTEIVLTVNVSIAVADLSQGL